MKKLNLLSKAEMKKVVGGVAPMAGCGVNYWCDGVRIDTLRGVSKDDAQMIAAAWDDHPGCTTANAYWCCDNCD